ncbi:MAG: glycosyltransferase [candidate division KSB1 bacterium]|nr:glycosyltransferase [candidate division KSB1 bacterium]
MEIILYIALGILFLILSTTLLNFFTAPRIARAPKLRTTPKVSILIPARNEEQNIGKCLDGLTKQDYPNFEIIVLNDHSDDNTLQVIQEHQKRDERIQSINGKDLPDGWLGKNWACHQLSQVATGDIFIFTDADNRHASFAVKNTVAHIQNLKLGLISAFPQQWTVTLAEKMIVPIMDIFVYGTLPLWATYYLPFPSMAAANGQWIAFTREAYQQLGGHETVKNELVEDTFLARLAKKKRIKILTTAGTDAVFSRMYQNANEVWHGFSKNFYGLAGYNNIVFFGIIFSMLIAFVSPYVLWLVPAVRTLALVAIGMNLLIRILISIKYKHPFWVSVLLHPISMLYAVFIGLNSFLSINRGTIRWKGREIRVRGGQ